MIALRVLIFIVISLPIILLQGCGGSGGTNNNSTAGTTTLPDTTWQFGQFDDADTFAHFCENPRQGQDPYENQPYPDKVGTSAHEKMWLRSFTHSTYLWYDEVQDTNPSNYASVALYFDALKTLQTTPSGKLKDEFHFTQSYEEYKKESQSGTASGYGVRWASINSSPPRIIRAAFTESNSPAEQAGILRGDTILAIDGVDINSSDIDALVAGLQPEAGTTHRFLLSRTGEAEPFEVTLTSQDVTLTPVQNTKTLNVNNKVIGYVQFNQFISAGQNGLISAFNQFEQENIDALVLDMRYNGGGLVDMAAQLGYMIAGPINTQADSNNPSTFSQTLHNNKQTNQNRRVPFEKRVIDWNTYQYTDNLLPSVSLDTVYILTTPSTCSASELVINGLRGIDINVIQIGSQTCGKPYGFSPEPNCGQVYFTVQFKSANAKGFGDYADGFTPVNLPSNNSELGLNTQVPGCVVNDDFEHLLGNENEALLSAALLHIETGQCPASPRPIANDSNSPEHRRIGLELNINDKHWRNNAIHHTISEQ